MGYMQSQLLDVVSSDDTRSNDTDQQLLFCSAGRCAVYCLFIFLAAPWSMAQHRSTLG